MRKQAPIIEWIIIENDAEWERQQALVIAEVAPAANARLPYRYCWRAAALLLLLVGGGSWHSGQAALSLPATNLRTPAEPALDTIAHSNDQWERAWWRQFRQQRDIQSLEPAMYEYVTLQTVEFAGNQAVARGILKLDSTGPAYQQTWFYLHTATGWLRTASPDATLWGAEHRLTTPYFLFHFRHRDAAVVHTIAPQIDALYTTLWHNFGLPILPTPEQLIIKVSTTQPPGQTNMFDVGKQVNVASPARYVSPVDLTDADLLAQSIALPLLEQVLAQASAYHTVGKSWQPMLDGLRLWQLWDLELPLAAWREEVVTLVYADLPPTWPSQAVELPARYKALCAVHKLWLPSPTEIHIPLFCAELAREEFAFAMLDRSNPLTHLDQLVVPLRKGESLGGLGPLFRAPQLGDTVALATLVEYAVATYGRERLPALVAGLGHYDSWGTLIPAVFGMPAAEFEAGWQAYLEAHYGVAVAHQQINAK